MGTNHRRFVPRRLITAIRDEENGSVPALHAVAADAQRELELYTHATRDLGNDNIGSLGRQSTRDQLIQASSLSDSCHSMEL